MYKKTLVVDGITPVGAYQALRQRSEGGSFLLESVVAGERWGRYSILGYRPRSQHVIYGEPGVDPFTRLSQLAPGGGADETDVAARFATACVGLLTYDMVHFVTKVEPWPELLDRKRPIARMISDATVVVFDNLTHTAVIAAQDPAEIERAEHDLSHATTLRLMAPPDPQALPNDVHVNMSDAEYCRAVERAKEYIRAGDAFQIVPARTFSTPTDGADPFDVYRAMRVLSPAPYMYLLELPERDGASAVAIAGASPETLVRVENKRITLRPIAGTRRRGRSPEEDQAFAEEMLADPKERAEHVMLIDLERNDLGRICEAGTVTVDEFMTIESYAHVHHIVSNVRGKLRPTTTPGEVLAAVFPGGTITGCPKVRCMEVIAELEGSARGAYTGSFGYLNRDGSMDLNILIRSLEVAGDQLTLRAGAGIVADSNPERELAETRAKARGVLRALGTEGGDP